MTDQDQFAGAADFGVPSETSTEPSAPPQHINGGMAPVDINNLDLYNDIEDIDPNASVYDQIPPPPPNWYQLSTSIVKDAVKEGPKRFMGDKFQNAVGYFQGAPKEEGGKIPTHFYIVVEYRVEAGEGKPGNGQTKRVWIMTTKDKTNSTPADTLLKGITGQAGVGLSNLAKIQRLYDLIVAGRGNIMAQIDWILEPTEDQPTMDRKTGKQKIKRDGGLQTNRDPFIKGMKNFPVDEVTKKPLILDANPKDGRPARTSWDIVNMKPLAGRK